MPRLLFVDNLAEHFCSHRLPLALAAKTAGWTVQVATPLSSAVAQIREAGLEHHPIAIDRRGLAPHAELASMLALRRLFTEQRPDLVHLRTIKPVIWGGIAAGMAGVPAVVAHITGLGYAFLARGPRAAALRSVLSPLYRLALAHPHVRVVFQNQDDRMRFTKMGVISRRRTVLVRGSGVDVRRFVPRPEPEGHPVVVFPARLLWDKGLAEFVQAARRLRRDGCTARFVLVGDVDLGNRASVTAGEVESWVREGVIEWWGHRSDMPEVYAQARIVCLPSYHEGLPKSLLEAAACARAVVTVDTPGCRDAVEHGRTGLVVEPRSVDELAHALGSLLADPDRCRRMGILGRERILAGFSEEQVVAETLAVYRDVLAEAGR
ncbi:MAG: glycosyltransferase family 4 protein [Planctomycetes bacterium]|nr:glycosyltransferase family 4 protein [Planctomycetota bacterium]